MSAITGMREQEGISAAAYEWCGVRGDVADYSFPAGRCGEELPRVLRERQVVLRGDRHGEKVVFGFGCGEFGESFVAEIKRAVRSRPSVLTSAPRLQLAHATIDVEFNGAKPERLNEYGQALRALSLRVRKKSRGKSSRAKAHVTK